MAESVGVIYYEVEADTSKLLNSVTPADQSLDRLQKTFGRTDKAANQANFQMTKTAAAVKSLGRESQTAASSLGGLTKLLGGYLTLQGANTLIQMAEGYREMGERIRFATSSQEEYEEVQRRLMATANGTYRALSEAQEVYILTADSLRSMGYSTEQALDITDSLSYAFVKNATSAERGANATRAYSNAIMKGKVEADGWSTIISAVPSIIQDIAAAAGLSAEEVRKLGAEGKLTAQQLNEGLRQSLEGNKAAADGMATTVRDAFNNMRNSLSAFLGESKSATGATGLLSSAIITLGNNIETVVQVLLIAGSGALAKYIAQMGASVITSGRAMLAARAQAAEELRLAQAHAATTAATLAHAQANAGLSAMSSTATRAAEAHTAALARVTAAKRAATAAGATLAGVLGGPVGIIALAASAGAAFLTMGGKAEGAKPKVDLLTGALNDLGDAQLRVLRTGLIDKISEMDSLEGVAAKAGARIEYLNRQLAMHPSSKNAESWRREIDEQKAAIEVAGKEISKYREQMRLVEEEQGKRSGSSKAAPKQQADPDVQKNLQAMRDAVELARLTGAARARLQAIQRLGDNALPEEREEAERLATEIYRLENAHKAANDATKQGKKETEENAKTLVEMAQGLGLAALKGEELAVAKARLRLSDAASQEEVDLAEALARSLHKVAEEENNRQMLGQLDPIANQKMNFEKQLEGLRTLNEAKLLEDQRYLDLKAQAEMAHAEQMQALQEQNFRAQSKTNELMMDSIEAAGSASASAISGVLSGISSGEDAARALANTILNQVVGAFVQMGVAQVKAWVMGRSAQAAAAAGYVASVAGQVAANTALAAQAAFASTAAIPIVGPGLAPGVAAASAAAAASLGAPAVAAASSALAGGRQYGGPVDAGKMYRINETGAPEILNTNGKQYLMMNQSSGRVEPMDRASTSGGQRASGGGGQGDVNVVIHIQSDGTTQTQTPPGMEQFGRHIGEMVRAEFQKLQIRSYRQGGLGWQQTGGGIR